MQKPNILAYLSSTLLTALVGVAMGCDPGAGTAPLHSASAAVTPPKAVASAAVSAPARSAPPDSKSPRTPVVAGASCAGLGHAISKEGSFKRDGDTWSREERWGCGCATADVFTMVYEPKTSPLRVRLCAEPQNDRCEALCQSTLRWDLTAPLREAGARDVAFVN